MLDKQMDVVKILRKLRHLKIISKLKFETPQLLLEVYRQSKNYINIDSDVVDSEDIEDFSCSEEEQPEQLDDFSRNKTDSNINMLSIRNSSNVNDNFDTPYQEDEEFTNHKV